MCHRRFRINSRLRGDRRWIVGPRRRRARRLERVKPCPSSAPFDPPYARQAWMISAELTRVASSARLLVRTSAA